MSGKRARQTRKSRQNKSHRPRAASKAEALPLPSPEEVVGAIVESIAPSLFELPTEEPRSSRSGIHAIMPPPRGEEHRAHPRVPLQVALGLETESHFFSGLSGDISEGGVFVQTYRDLPVGSDVEVQFELPEGPLTVHGRVRWHRENSDSSPPGVGIAFDALADEDREIIQRFCAYRAPLYYDVEHG